MNAGRATDGTAASTVGIAADGGPATPWSLVAITETDLHDVIATLGPEPRLARRIASLQHRLLTGTALPPADEPKRWDEANVVNLFGRLDKDARIVDHGGYNSPAPWALARRGFRNVEAIDLNPRLPASPYARRIRYSCQNMMTTAYRSGSVDAVMSGSTVEHGVDWEEWLTECRRILRPGGLLYVSTDLIHDHVATSDLEAFGLPWTPLRPKDLAGIADLFVACGFERPEIPVFDLPERLPVTFLGQRHGFIAFAVRTEAD